MYILDICEDLSAVIKLVKNGLIPILQIGIPIVLIVFGMIDLGKAVIASDDKKIKEAQSMLIKRAIYAVAIFFIVTIVTLVFNLFVSSGASEDEDVGNVTSWRTCWDKY